MAFCDEPDWEALLKAKYNSYKVEVEAYLNSLDISTSSDISMGYIYEAIADDKNINPDLKCLYVEACFGSNKDVKSRIRNQISNFRRMLRFGFSNANSMIFDYITIHAPDKCSIYSFITEVIQKLREST